ncbi:MAG: DUF2510 domain-containing protein [Acidimicrobiaceae bacterium]|nr:DUF2510 domain-containing protein [Acidimicrobiaceae bacterium]MXW75618.1 DUF2510 domain-containing protein [Acidimicrobiaceae bacterium]MYC42584.1 DUF2510 domain-containing protein [Acidimicrobiaceae bacterium]MYD05800.1 DUF2510 domain-containing protein [Acidimicrobiaceae bacterium]MYH88362.1 DUF2510 domain-containing protein [Acidimicrobiaceae bacterium]
MLTNAREIELDPVPDLPPPNWYTDPDDESQYRYWDGSVWTDHRAPRLAEEAGSRLRPAGDVLRGSFSLMRRQRSGSAVAIVAWVLSYAVVVLSFLFSADDILMGELGEIWSRVSEPGFDATTADNEAYFESLEFNFTVQNLAVLVVGLLISWIAGLFASATVSILAVSDLRGLRLRMSEVLRRALTKVPRLVGVNFQVLMIGLVALAVIVVPSLVAPALLLLLIPFFIAFFFLSMTVVSLAYIFAAVGPAGSSLRYAFRLVRGRFWGVLGRMLLVLLVAMAVSFVTGMVVGLATAALGAFWWVSQVANSLVSFFFAVLITIATAIIYHDLGGESE